MSHPSVVAWMETDPIVLRDDLSVAEALRILARRHTRHALVQRQGALVGVVTQGDLHRALPSPLAGGTGDDYARVLDTVTLAKVMTREPATVGPGTNLADAAGRMLELGVHCLPVVDRGRLMGLLTARGCLRALIERLHLRAGAA